MSSVRVSDDVVSSPVEEEPRDDEDHDDGGTREQDDQKEVGPIRGVLLKVIGDLFELVLQAMRKVLQALRDVLRGMFLVVHVALDAGICRNVKRVGIGSIFRASLECR